MMRKVIDDRGYDSAAADHELGRRLRVVVWCFSAPVLVLVVAMQRIRVPLPEGWSTAMLPAFHSSVNALVSIVLVAGFVSVRGGWVMWHRRAMSLAFGLSVLFLLSYVVYHLTNDPVRYAGTGWLRPVYFFLLISHIVLAALSLPAILLALVAAWTRDFDRHRRLARVVFPAWLYVAVTGPVCYLMLRAV